MADYGTDSNFDCRSRSKSAYSQIYSSQHPEVVMLYLVVMLNLENEVIDHTLSHVHLAVDEQSERDEIGVPVVQLKGEKI